MSTDLDAEGGAGHHPIRSTDELAGWFAAGCKPREKWGIGLEYERLGVFTETGAAIPYSGSNSVAALLEDLVAAGWTPHRENGHPIALSLDKTFITLEPGGQTEFSSRVHFDLHELRDDLCRFIVDLNSTSERHSVSWIGLGLQPFSKLQEIAWIPKKRYKIMSAHLARTGTLSHNMMKQTAGIQVNLDYASEADAAAKFRALMGISPLITALFANSPLQEGRPSGLMSTRAAIWQDTDPARCGMLRLAFEDRPIFQAYLDYALAVPMIFVVREGRWIAVDIPFRTFVADGFKGLSATRADWELHLTTLFPDVRIKRFLEARFADSADAALAMAHAAMLRGIVYDGRANSRAWELVSTLSWEERLHLHRDVARDGLRSRAADTPVLDLARELVSIARDGLRRLHEAGGPDDTGFLAPLEIILADGESPARRLVRLWGTSLRRDRASLVAHLSRVNLSCYER